MIYLASPYSHISPAVVDERVHQTFCATAFLIGRGLVIFSPIVYAHEMALRFHMPTDAAFWERFNREMQQRCDEFYILCLEGWINSVGLSREQCLAEDLNQPISYVTMERFIVSVSKKAP